MPGLTRAHDASPLHYGTVRFAYTSDPVSRTYLGRDNYVNNYHWRLQLSAASHALRHTHLVQMKPKKFTPKSSIPCSDAKHPY